MRTSSSLSLNHYPSSLFFSLLRSLSSLPSLPITHPQHHHNVQDGQNRKGITKRAVHHVPQVKHLFGPGQKQNSFGQGRLSSRGLNGEFQLGIARLENSKQSDQPREEPARAQTQPGHLEGTFQVQPDHPAQRRQDRSTGHLRRTRQREQIDQARPDLFVLFLRVPPQMHFRILNFLDG